MAQHLKTVEAASSVGMARVDGAQLGSQDLNFEPSQIRSGNFHFAIGTAGSTSLLLQTIVLPLSFAKTASTVTVTGGTHVPWSPCFHFLDLHWRHFMKVIGFDVVLELNSAGFYPAGGGRVRALVQPSAMLSPLRLTNRGLLKGIRGISAVANLDVGIAERQKKRAVGGLVDIPCRIDLEIVHLPSPSRGTLLLLIAEFEHSRCCFFALGSRGKPAERVADEAVGELREFLATNGAIDHYLADQLVVPLALARGVSELQTSRLTQHLTTNVEVVKMFLPVGIEIVGQIGQPGLVRITGAYNGRSN
jgi:RNA 3'-terminal phosphate cyclase (ATP)